MTLSQLGAQLNSVEKMGDRQRLLKAIWKLQQKKVVAGPRVTRAVRAKPHRGE